MARRSARLSEAAKSVQDDKGEESDLSDLSDFPESQEQAAQEGASGSSFDIIGQDEEPDSPEEKVISDNSSDEDFEPGRKRPKKKAKKKKSKSKRSSTKPQGPLLSLPTEMLLHVLSFADFESLYNLSFVNKRFRAIVTDGSCDLTWLSIMERDGVPQASGMPFIQQAHLFLSTRCFECSKTTEKLPDGFLRVLLCQSCRSHLTVSTEQVLSVFSAQEEVHPLTRKVVKGDRWRGKRLRSRIRSMNQYLLDNFPAPKESGGRWNDYVGDWNWTRARPRWAPRPPMGPLTQVGTFVQQCVQNAQTRDREATKIGPWVKSHRRDRWEARACSAGKRLDELKAMLLENGWSADDFGTNWTAWNVPNIVFKPVHLDNVVFQTLLPHLTTWIAGVRRRRQEQEERIREEQRQRAELEQQRERESQEREAQLRARKELAERKKAALRKLFNFYSAAAEVDSLKLPFTAFALLPSIQPILDGDEGGDFDVESCKEEAIREAIEASNVCKESMLIEFKEALCILAEKVPHLKLEDVIGAGPISAEDSVDDFRRRFRHEAAVVAFFKLENLSGSDSRQGRARFSPALEFTSMGSIQQQLSTNSLFTSFTVLNKVLRNELNMQTATDWACSNKLLRIQPRYVLAYLVAVQALKRQNVPASLWISAVNRTNACEWYCPSCGVFNESPLWHVGVFHLYSAKGERPPSPGEPDNFDKWNVRRLPELTYLKPPTHRY